MTKGDSCCSMQSRVGDRLPAAAGPAATTGGTAILRRWSPPIGGSFMMGSNDTRFLDDGEGPVRQVAVSEFTIACFAVSNLQFGDFVRATGYTTDAERYGWSFVFTGLLTEGRKREIGSRATETPWWIPVQPT